LLAGADTTGTAFQAVLHYLFTHPECYKKMQAEIDNATRKGQLSYPVPQYAEVQQHCPYYNAVIKESMRLCPSAPNIFPRMVGEGGLDLFGRYAPAGSEVTCNPWFVARDKTLYGEDAEDFRPERWLEDAEKAKEYTKYSMVFGYGARVCLGKDVAMMEMCKGPLLVRPPSPPPLTTGMIVSCADFTQFFQHFEPQLVDPTQTGDFIVHGGIGFWERINVTIKRRKLVKRET
jgi:cytochrome P450